MLIKLVGDAGHIPLLRAVGVRLVSQPARMPIFTVTDARMCHLWRSRSGSLWRFLFGISDFFSSRFPAPVAFIFLLRVISFPLVSLQEESCGVSSSCPRFSFFFLFISELPALTRGPPSVQLTSALFSLCVWLPRYIRPWSRGAVPDAGCVHLGRLWILPGCKPHELMPVPTPVLCG